MTYKYNRASKAATLQMTSDLETELITPLVSSYVAQDKGRLVMWQRLRRCITPTSTLITCTVQKQDVSFAKLFIYSNRKWWIFNIRSTNTNYRLHDEARDTSCDEWWKFLIEHDPTHWRTRSVNGKDLCLVWLWQNLTQIEMKVFFLLQSYQKWTWSKEQDAFRRYDNGERVKIQVAINSKTRLI